MKKEDKLSNIACNSYHQHQFKQNFCGKCLKPLAQHSIGHTLEPINVKIIELQSGDNNDIQTLDKVASNKFQNAVTDNDSLTNGSHTENGIAHSNGVHENLLSHSNGRVSRKGRRPPQVRDKPSDSRLKRQSPVVKSSVSKSPPKVCSSNGHKTTRRADSVPESEAFSSPTEKEQVRLTLSESSRVTGNTKEGNDENIEQSLEFQRVARSLKKVKTVVNNNDTETSTEENTETPENQHSSNDQSNSDTKNSLLEIEQKMKLVALKSNLPSQVLSDTAYIVFNGEKHDTLPRNIGSNVKRPSLSSLIERHDSDPEIYEPEQIVEEINVVLLKNETDSTVISHNQKVTGSHISSEIYFGMNPKKRNGHTPSQSDEPSLNRDSREITIISADGSVSRYTESPPPHSVQSEPRVSTNSSTLSSLSLYSSESNSSNASSKVKPYKVVDLESRPCAPYMVTDIPGVIDCENRLSQSSSSGDQNKPGHRTKFHQKITLVDSTYTVKGRQFGRASSEEMPGFEESAEQSPTLPIILHKEMDHIPKSAKRNSDSSLYRVPIFISPKVEDANRTLLYTSEPIEIPGGSNSPDKEYLKPMSSYAFNEIKNTVQHTYDSVPESETDLSEVSKSTSSSEASNKKSRARKSAEIKANQKSSGGRSRKRSVTHPESVPELKSERNSRKKLQFSDEDLDPNTGTVVKMRQKRSAPPPPPVEEKPRRSLSMYSETTFLASLDTMPRTPPPPPPHQRKNSQPFLKDQTDHSSKSIPPRTVPVANQIGSAPKSNTLPVNCRPPSSRDQTPDRRIQSTRRDYSPDKNIDRKKGSTPLPKYDRPQSPLQREIRNKLEGRESVDPLQDVLASYSPPRNVSTFMDYTTAQRPITLPVNVIEPVQPITRESKSKRSKLPWKMLRPRRKDEPGSPELQFNSKGVSDWLINKHMTEEEIAAIAQVESLKRLEVISAYKGETIPVINNCQLDYSKPASEHGLSKFYIDTYEPIDSPPLPRLTNSNSKRKAPGPPDFMRNEQLLIEFKTRKQKTPAMLQKSHSFTSVSTIKSDTYENWGPSRSGLPPPQKPSRRFRNRTTGFEDLPSQIYASKKRMAPRIPCDSGSSREDSDRAGANQSSQDEAEKPKPMARRIRSNSLGETSNRGPEVVMESSSIPLKSAMKNTNVNHASEVTGIPKRPVRVLDPSPAAKASHVTDSVIYANQENMYANVNLIMNGVDGSAEDRLKPVPAPRIKKLLVDHGTSPLTDIELVDHNGPLTSLQTSMNPLDPLLAQVTNRNVLTLSKITSAWQNRHENCPRLEEVMLGDFKLMQEVPYFTSEEARFYRAEYVGNEETNFTLMVYIQPEEVDPVYKLILSLQLMLPHPNVVNVCSASKTLVPHSLIIPESTATKSHVAGSQSEELVETMLVALTIQPVSNVDRFVNCSKDKHDFMPEEYEGEVITLLLQLFSGLQHLENNNITLSTVKMQNLLLVESGLPGGGNYLVVDYLNLAEREETELINGTLVSPSILNKTNEFDAGILIYKMLHQPNPFSIKTNLIIRDYVPSDLPKIPKKSKYSHGLRRLAGELLQKSPKNRLSARESIGLLQLMLWGPSHETLVDMVKQGTIDEYLAKWHVHECTKMVNHIAEQQVCTLIGNQNSFSLVDLLHCQFLSKMDINLLKYSFKILNS